MNSSLIKMSSSPKTIRNLATRTEISDSWQKFLQGGVTNQFLTDMTTFYRSYTLAKKSSHLSQHHNFIKEVEEGLRILSQSQVFSEINYKVILSCLTSIKGLHFKSQSRSTVEALLVASTEIGKNFRFSNNLQFDELSLALTRLLSNNQPVASMEVLFQKELHSSGGEHDFTKPLPYGFAKILSKSEAKLKKITQLSPSITEPSSPSNLKIVSTVTLHAFHIFPFLFKLNVDEKTLKDFVNDLCGSDNRVAVLRFMLIYPDRFGPEDLVEDLFESLFQNLNWPEVGQFFQSLLTIREMYRLKYYKSIDDNANVTLFDALNAHEAHEPPTERENEILQTRAFLSSDEIDYIYNGILFRKSIDSTESGRNNFLTIPDEDFENVLKNFVTRCVQENITLSLRAAVDVAAAMNNEELLKEVKSKALYLKLTTFVKKDKWGIAIQFLSSVESKVMMYNMLFQEGKYVEAKAFYELAMEELQGQVTIVSETQVIKQRTYESSTYLPFPLPDSGVIIVDSIETVCMLAEALSIDLTDQHEIADWFSSTTKAVSSDYAAKRVVDWNTLTKSSFVGSREQKSQAASGADEFQRVKEVEESSETSRSLSILTETMNTCTISSDAVETSYQRSRFDRFQDIIGLDSEWAVEVNKSDGQTSADILQLSTRDKVFVIDLYCLSKLHFVASDSLEVANPCPESSDSSHSLLFYVLFTLNKVFCDPSILKVGFGFSMSDDKMLERVGNGYFRGLMNNSTSFFDLKENGGGQQLGKVSESLPSKVLGSLSDYCEVYLGRPLSKNMRCSNWKQRPLSADQLQYAALDAHSLIGIVDAMLLQHGTDWGIHVYEKYYSVYKNVPKSAETSIYLSSETSETTQRSST